MRESTMLRAYMDALTEPALLLDRSLQALAVNAAMSASLCRSAESLIGLAARDFLPPPVREQRIAQLERVVQTGEAAVFEDERKGRRFLNHMSPAFSPEGEVTAIAVFAVDITKQRVAEQAAADSAALYKQIVTTCLEGVWRIDQNNKCTFVNQQMADILGYSVAEFQGRELYDFMDAEAQADAEELVKRRKQGISERGEFRLRHKSGHDVWTTMAANPLLDADGQYIGALALVTDITEQRSITLKMQQAQKLESLGVLAGGIAHDFNNLLVGILGNTGLAKEEVPPGSAVQELLQDVESAAHRAAELTRQMLAYAGKASFSVEVLSLNQLVSEVTHLLKSVISRTVSVVFDLAKELPAIKGDAAQLRQVVMNFVTNASDAIGEKPGVIRITTGRTQLSAKEMAQLQVGTELEPGQFVWLDVRDDGCGISDDALSKIFDPFYSTKFIGRGLGLAAVVGILRGHEAGVRIISQPGIGSSFRLFFPVSEQPLPSVKAPPSTKPVSQNSGTILVVDDEQPVRTVARRMLERAGFNVITCEDGNEALAVFRAPPKPIRLVLLDLTMPKLSGAATFEGLVQLDPDVRVLLCSGFADQDADPRFDHPALKGFLKKPYRTSELVSSVQQVLEQE